MSEPKLISPLLDGFLIGKPISEHDGVRCYPAMKEDSDEKYILKIISVPASQVQLDALLLTGAYKDPSEAMDYFKAEAERVEAEAQVLKTMAKLEGFLPFDSWQIVPMEDGKLGYEIYLLSAYKRSLEKYIKRNGITHLEAINLGLDMCQALAICRRGGYIYADLKPSNIFISKEKGYRISDLGFIALDSLQYTSLPAKYQSSYSPPETYDDLKTLNQTIDTYAVGMLLYQIYNDSSLPSLPKEPDTPIPSPSNADYELAEIIMKAIAFNPAERWQTPMEMGQALVAYMQRNSVNNTPIAAPKLELNNAETIILPNVKQLTETLRSTSSEETTASEETASSEDSPNQEPPVSEGESDAEECIQAPDPANAESETKMTAVISSEKIPETPEIDFAEPEDDIFFSDFLDPEESLPSDVPEAFEKKTAKKEPASSVAVKNQQAVTQQKNRGKGIITIIVCILIFAILGGSAYFYYHNIYLLTIQELTVVGTQNQLTVNVTSDFDEALLSVRCSDSYGNGTTQAVVNGQAVFNDLLPDSLYRIELQVEGFHKLVGKTSEIFTTDALTKIVAFNAVMGPEDGSVVLNFTPEGPEPEQWVVSCAAEGEETITHNFTGHSITVRGLAVGKLYTFSLSCADGMEISGENSIKYQVSRTITAENLTVISCIDGVLTVTWNAPEDTSVSSWNVRCYDDDGYESVQEVTTTQAVFNDIKSSAAYTVEVTAGGMTQPARTSISANPITVGDVFFDENDQGELVIQWTFDGADPKGGWYLMYSLDNSLVQNIVKSETASVSINPRVFGATYSFEIQAADGTSIFNNRGEYTCENVDVYVNHGLSAEKITSYLLKTPDGDWTFDQLGNDVFADQFTSGDNISMVLKASVNFYLDNEELDVLYVIRDESGNVLPEYLSQETLVWNALWFAGDYHVAEMNIPKVPDKPGTYSINVYFNSAAVTSTTFTITE